jgi:hypothetical protein
MIIIAPFAQKLRNGKENPKNYPYWEQLISLIDEPIVQVGIQGEKQLVPDFRPNLSSKELGQLVAECKSWISVDSYFQHFAWNLGKYGVVIWGPSDFLIFGHPENANILKDRKYLRENQFLWWEDLEYSNERFVSAEEVFMVLQGMLSGTFAIEKSNEIKSNINEITE